MKKSSVLIVIIIVLSLAVVTGMILLALRYAPSSGGSPVDTPEAYSYEVLSVDTSSLSGLSWSRDGHTYSLSLSDGVWNDADDPELPIDPQLVAKLAGNLKNLTSDKRLTGITEKTYRDYGLSEPSLTVTLTDAAYGARTLLVGGQNPLNDRYYVALSSDRTVVYTVDPAPIAAFAVTPVSLLRFDQLDTVTAMELKGFDLTLGEDIYRFQYEVRGITADNVTHYWYVSVNGAPNRPVGDEGDSRLTDIITMLAYDKLLSWKASDMPEYGISGEAVLTVSYIKTFTVPGETEGSSEKRSYTLRFGTSDAGGFDYVCPEGTSTVYRLSVCNVLSALSEIAESCR